MRPLPLLLAGLVVAGCSKAEAPELAVGSMARVVDEDGARSDEVLAYVGTDGAHLPVGAEVKVLQLPDADGNATVHVEAGLARAFSSDDRLPATTAKVHSRYLRPVGR